MRRVEFSRALEERETKPLEPGHAVLIHTRGRHWSGVVRAVNKDDGTFEVQRADPQNPAGSLVHHRVPRGKLSRPTKKFCSDPRWLRAAVEDTGFEPETISLRLKRMKVGLQHMAQKERQKPHPAYGRQSENGENVPPVMFPIVPVPWKR